MIAAAPSRQRGTRYWVGYAIAFILSGVVGPLLLAFLTLGFAFSFGAGISPAWFLLAYPLLIGVLYLLRQATGGEDVARGLFAGIRWGSLLTGVLVALFLAPALHRALSGGSGFTVVLATLILAIVLVFAGVLLIRMTRGWKAVAKRGADPR
jgi:hypothetical protein